MALEPEEPVFTWKVPLQDTALEPSLLASSEDAVYQITLPLATTSPGQALEMTGAGQMGKGVQQNERA